MSKTITIPTWRNPYEVEINGVKYSYPAGSTQTVDNHVAAVIQRDIDAHADTAAPQMVQPRWGKYKTMKLYQMSGSFYIDNDIPCLPMTAEQYAWLCKAPKGALTNSYYDGGEDADITDIVDLADTHWQDGYLYFDNAYGGSTGDAFVEAKFEYEAEAIEKIPGEYLAGVAVLDMRYDSENNYWANMTPYEVYKLIASGIPVICQNTFDSTGETGAGFVIIEGDWLKCASAGMPEVAFNATEWTSY